MLLFIAVAGFQYCSSVLGKSNVPSEINGKGIVALRPLKKGQKVHYPKDGLPHGFNHSCNPNMTDRGRDHLKPLRDIQEGEELTLDYRRDGFGIRFDCNCPSCRAKGDGDVLHGATEVPT